MSTETEIVFEEKFNNKTELKRRKRSIDKRARHFQVHTVSAAGKTTWVLRYRAEKMIASEMPNEVVV